MNREELIAEISKSAKYVEKGEGNGFVVWSLPHQ